MDIYEKLGVKTFINAAGTVTAIGGSRMDPRVLDAMAEASVHYVDIYDYHHKAGESIAKMLGVEACCITCGATSGIMIASAACMTRGDRAKVLRLPDTAGMPDEAIILKSHRIMYDIGIRLSGSTIVEVGTTSRSEIEELEAAITYKTAFVFYVAEAIPLRGSIDLKKVIQAAHKYGVPVNVDAAAELPPKENIHTFLDQGADLVIFSGGKELRGPQSTGLILGKKNLIEACEKNCCPVYSIGRPLKIDKESIAGIHRAVELFVDKDYKQQCEDWNKVSQYIAKKISKACTNAKVHLAFPTSPGIQPVSILRVYISHENKSKDEIKKMLLEGVPAVYAGEDADEIVINPQCIEKEEVESVVEALSKALN